MNIYTIKNDENTEQLRMSIAPRRYAYAFASAFASLVCSIGVRNSHDLVRTKSV